MSMPKIYTMRTTSGYLSEPKASESEYRTGLKQVAAQSIQMALSPKVEKW